MKDLLFEYCQNHTTKPSAELVALSTHTQATSHVSHMQIGPLEGKLISLLIQIAQVEHVLELGTFTGYSALTFAESLPPHGTVTTLDRDPVHTSIAKEHWQKSPHGKKISLILGVAKQTIEALQVEILNQRRPPFDLIFIDADKASYAHYWDACFNLSRPGGMILVDNVLWSGKVLEPKSKSDHTMHAFNEMTIQDTRVEQVMLPLRDGLLLARIK